QSYASLRAQGLGALGDAMVTMENELPFGGYLSGGVTPAKGSEGDILGIGNTLYFGIPTNQKLLDYWDTVADRLFKVRTSMNIEGGVQQLPLFEPPINPALLVQAAAGGIDLNTVLGDLSAPMPYYRFSYLLQKALELCTEVQALGAALLAALEKGDAEALAVL